MRSLLGLCCLILVSGVSAPARAEPTRLKGPKSPELLADVLGEGSLLAQPEALEFGLTREITYCDGAPVGFLQYYFSRNCCTVHLNRALLLDHQRVGLKPRIHTIALTAAYLGDHLASVAGELAELIFTCSAGVVTKKEFDAAFGGAFRVIVRKPLSDERPERRRSLQAELKLPEPAARAL